nr:transcription antitermination factor NusB [Rubricella aquisinus]
MGAAALLERITQERVMLTEATDILESLAPQDRARAQRLALTALRQLPRIDAVLARFLKKPPPPQVRAVIQIATAEMLVLDTPAHGAVDAAVSGLKADKRMMKFAGLTNAVLRKVDGPGREVWAGLKPPRLPKWLRGRLMSAYGSDAVAAMEAVFASEPPLDLTPKGPMPDMDGAIPLPTGTIRLPRAGQVTALPGFEEGAWWVQDAAAALPVRVLGDVAGKHVLDLCAAPGGKTMQLAAAGARVTALDISNARLKRLRANLERTGLGAGIIAADAFEWTPDAPFDAIMLDAPCSATGTIRRHPELPLVRDSKAVAQLAKLQAALLDRALAWLKPGGDLIYCTCSLLPEEGEAQITPRSGITSLAIDPIALGGEPHWTTKDGHLRLRPDFWADRGGMDGFFIAHLRKDA